MNFNIQQVQLLRKAQIADSFSKGYDINVYDITESIKIEKTGKELKEKIATKIAEMNIKADSEQKLCEDLQAAIGVAPTRELSEYEFGPFKSQMEYIPKCYEFGPSEETPAAYDAESDTTSNDKLYHSHNNHAYGYVQAKKSALTLSSFSNILEDSTKYPVNFRFLINLGF